VFESCHPFSFFDYFRVPCDVRPALAADHHGRIPGAVHRLRIAGESGGRSPSLLWSGAETAPATGVPGRYRLRDCTFFAHVALGPTAPSVLGQLGQGWHPIEQVFDDAGQPCAAIWQDADGSVFLPFDPGEVMLQFWSEGYERFGRSSLAVSGRDLLLRGYYLVRPVMPRRLQLRLRRGYTRVQSRASFPSWPVEDSLHAFYTWLFRLVAELTGQPVPYLDPWPDGRSWALVLTHDVETGVGCDDLDLLRGPERELGYRSSWNFVPLRDYQVSDDMLRTLRQEGCEVGVHGLRHDGRDLGSQRLLAKRLPMIREYADRWQAVGFRSPATQRKWEMMPRLGFEYDSSYTDTDPYEPQPGGCCSYLPYFNESLVELPITMPQDHTVFSILQHRDAELWLRKARLLRERNGMVLVLTHPDYARDRVAEAYRSLLEAFHGDSTVWHALPREVADWWRARATSHLRRDGDGWQIEGPASAQGRIRFATADGYQSVS
jgi:hypothetical protein